MGRLARGDVADWVNAALLEVGLEPDAHVVTLRSTGTTCLVVPGLADVPLRHRAGMLAMLHAHGPNKTVTCKVHSDSADVEVCGRVAIAELLLDPDVRCCPLV